MKNRKAVFLSIALVLSAVAGVAAFTRGASGPAQEKAEHRHEERAPEKQNGQQEDQGLEVVEAKYVCMINDQRFPKEQFAVEAEGRTYYGCCEMCKERLESDARARTATDPVSGRKVDKAKAVIGAAADGRVFYFESEENLKKFKAAPKS